ncbi:hemagglutinin repeat-containing protein [Herminiimonas fonticola]|uniref:Filamentous hemagglutinin n=1 Tax=Herminiimonas fonticola TaxID=303380 RepID=A0A4R6G8K7_9BURK|nr:hemagglutinin repeat-containing protein [Herminiimonas fonticola]RBA24165.1 filamentous hemagglutinin family N-terminal domain [Herminiimonas fonticola]TDN90164.1 filamentous hemagglutinin [Herminiimonas fonticola]
MNKNLYRIVFNKARGILMVVAENVSAQGKGDADPVASIIAKQETDLHCLKMRQISFAAKLAAGVMALVMPLAHAQIVADPNAPGNQRPTILQTANGLPQVNIQTPSAAGVSRNTYSQFDVQSNGAILNNSRTNTATQTGGWIQGNPWLVGGAARVILNEVNSSNPSQLRGYIEVAGQRAEVIIANPAGIQVNGGGFINADRVTLTTGTAVMNQANGGSLDSYRIPQGTINIDGLGLDTRTASYTDILARSVQVNAGIWANRLKVVTGANEVSTTSTDYPGDVSQGVTPIAGTGPVPQFSLDVAALGGMYAGHIYLVGSESGLGVRNKGAINAAGGNLVLLSNGLLTNEGAIQAASSNGSGGNVKIDTAGGISNVGANAVISAQGQASIVTATGLLNEVGAKMEATSLLAITAGSIDNAGKLTAGDAITLNAGDIGNAATGEIAGNTTKIAVTNNLTNRGLIDGSNVLVEAGTLDNIGTGRIYGDDLGIAANVLNNDTETINGLRSDAVIAARQRLDLGVGTLNNRNGSLLFSAGVGANALNIGGNLDAQGQATGTVGTLNNAAATIESLGGANISALQINNINPDFSIRTDTSYAAASAHYIRLGGTRYLESELGRCFKCASDRYDNGDPNLPRLEYVAPSAQYPFEAGYSRVPYQLEAYVYDEFSDSTITVSYAYPAGSPVWALFNVPEGDQVQLSSRLLSYNQNLISRGYRDYYHIWVTSTETIQTVVDNPGAPGRIISGSAMKLSGGAILNDNSQILADGNLDITGSNLTSTETSGNRQVTDFGSFRGDSVKYKGYGVHEGYFGTGSYVYVSESVTTKLDTSLVEGNRSVSGTGTQLTTRTAPTSSILRSSPNPAATYIFEVDPRFANQQQWLSSDYMLQVLSTDPNTIQKRLGDGFYEQKLIREQVAQLTGRRFLDGYASDEAQYQGLMQSGVTYAQKWNLVPGIALTASQVAQLTSDMVWLVAQEVVLPDGTKTMALVPQVYAMPKAGDLAANGSLLAGQNVNIQLTGDLKNSGTIGGRKVMQISADNVQNLGTIGGKGVNVVAQQDLINFGGRMIAEDSLTATAGRDLIVQSTTSTGSSSAGLSSSSLTQVDRVAGLYVTGDKGILVASAGNDFSVLAGVLSSTGSIQATAGNNVNLGTADTAYASDLTANERNYMRESGMREVGSQIVSGGNIILAAGNDTHVRAATVNATGDLTLSAGGDVKIVEGRTTRQSDDARYATSSGFLSKSTTESRNQSQSDIAIGSSLGGKTVTLGSGGDTLIRGSNVVGDNGTTVVAGRDLSIQAATNTSQSSSFNETKKSGLFSSGGLSITYGKQQLSTDQNKQSTNASASTVGSVGGDIVLLAGQTYSQIGSDVLAPSGDISIAAKKVDIVAATNTYTNSTEQRFKQSGLTLAITSPIISAIQTVQQMAVAASQTSDGRMKALAGATAGLAAQGGYDAIQAGQGATINGKENQIATGKDAQGNPTSRDATAADQVGGVNLSISIGASSSESKTIQTGINALGSTIAAGGNVTIVASGAGKNSDVTVQGSDIGAGNNVIISAEDEIKLLAARNADEQHSTNKSNSGSIGISIGTSGFGVTASASSGRGNADGKDVSWSNTHINAGNQLALVSGGDTNLIGAVANGKQVVANVGGDLNIESLQDTSKYDSKQKDIAASITIGAGASTGSLSYSKSSVNSDYANVSEQSGIKAGDEGFQVKVGGNTDLKGAVIASTDNAVQDDKNALVTASLTTSDITNHAEASAKSSGINLSSDMLAQGKYGIAKGIIGTSLNNGKESGSSEGVTHSAIESGRVVLTNEAAQLNLTGKSTDETVATLNRNTSNAQHAAQKLDLGAMMETVEAERAIKQEAFRQATIVTDAVYKSATGPKKIMLQKCTGQGTDCSAVEVDMSTHKITIGPDGKVYVFNHGISNTEQDALANAAKQSDAHALEQGVYVVINPHTGSALAEVLYAGWDKVAGTTFGISNASEANIDLRDQVKAAGGMIMEVDHSRGNITSFNATQTQIERGQTNVPVSFVQMNGSPINALVAQQAFDVATGAVAKVFQSTHQNDFISTFLGSNPTTGGLTSIFGAAHGSYGPNVSTELAERVWGVGQKSISIPSISRD